MQCLDKVVSVGFDRKVIMCDQGSNNRPVFQRFLCVNVVTTYVVNWQHIVNVHQADSNLPIRMEPKPTNQHIELLIFC